MAPLSKARLIAVMAPFLLLAGALLSQYGFGLVPCEMCMWQRWTHVGAIVLALIAIALRGEPGASRAFTVLAALTIAGCSAVGAFHAGVEYGWWEGLTTCSTSPVGGNAGDILNNIMATPLVRCDVAQWTLGGISLAGFNALLSLAAAIAIFLSLSKAKRSV